MRVFSETTRLLQGYRKLSRPAPVSNLRRLFELLPSADGLTLQWSEVLPAQRKNQSPFGSDEKASNEGHVVTHLLSADHSDGDQLVYILSGGPTIHWSRPTLSSVLATAE